MNTNVNSEVRCLNCNDLIDISHNPKNCLKCGHLVAGFKEIKKAPFVSHPGYAFLIALATAIFMFVIIGNILNWIGIGGIFIPAAVAVIFSISIGVYKYLVSMGED